MMNNSLLEKRNPLVSIIIPIYNSESYLKKCLDSILNQPFRDFELILVNDGSTDSSFDICKQYLLDDRVTLLNQKNLGPSVARNKALEYSSGSWICFVDSDDWIDNSYFKPLIDYKDIADVIYFGFSQHYADGISVIRELPNKIVDGKDNIRNTIFWMKKNSQNWCFFGYTCNKFFRASIIVDHNIKFDSTLSWHEDEVFTLDCFKHIESIAFSSISPYHYQYVSGGLTNREHKCSDYEALADSYGFRVPELYGSLSYELYCTEISYFYLSAFFMCDKLRNKERLIKKIQRNSENMDFSFFRRGWKSRFVLLLLHHHFLLYVFSFSPYSRSFIKKFFLLY